MKPRYMYSFYVVRTVPSDEFVQPNIVVWEGGLLPQVMSHLTDMDHQGRRYRAQSVALETQLHEKVRFSLHRVIPQICFHGIKKKRLDC